MASGDLLGLFLPLMNEPPAAAFATLDTRNGHPVLDFDGATDEEAVFTGYLDGAVYDGGGLTLDLYVMFTSATSGNARWQAGIERMDAGLDLDADSFAAFKSAAGNPNATTGIWTKATITFTSGAEMDSVVAGEPFRLKIRRDADGTSGTDDVTTDAEVLLAVLKET